MTFEALIFDVDGTLVTAEKILPEEAKSAAKALSDAGLMLAILYVQAPPMARLYVGASDEEQAAEVGQTRSVAL